MDDDSSRKHALVCIKRQTLSMQIFVYFLRLSDQQLVWIDNLRFKMASNLCIECQKPVGQHQQALQCDGCNEWQHRTCNTGVSRQRYRNAVRTWGEIDWQCSNCSNSEPVSIAVPTEKNHKAQDTGSFKESMEDAVINDILATDHAQIIKYEVKLIDNLRFSHTRERKYSEENVVWGCTVRNKTVSCLATVRQKDKTFIPGLHNHCHQPTEGASITTKVMNVIK